MVRIRAASSWLLSRALSSASGSVTLLSSLVCAAASMIALHTAADSPGPPGSIWASARSASSSSHTVMALLISKRYQGPVLNRRGNGIRRPHCWVTWLFL